MRIGVPAEIKNNENRVALTPAGVGDLVRQGNHVFVQKSAGINSGFEDDEYISFGAEMCDTLEAVYKKSELIVKVKEPQEVEYKLLKPHHILFTYLHLAASKKLTEALIESRAICIAYETVMLPDGSLPLLTPMSQVAGRLAVQEGVHFLLKHSGGRGVLAGGVPGVAPANVVILGGGVVGTEAAKMAAGLGARVQIFDINPTRLGQLSELLPANVIPLFASQAAIADAVKEADLIVGAVLIPGGKAPHLIKREMLKTMRKGSVIVDVAVDQGGCVETCKVTTHDNPVFVEEGIIHYGVANMPGAVPFTSTHALTNATLPFTKMIAGLGWRKACYENESLIRGVSLVNGQVMHKEIAELFDLPFADVETLIQDGH